MQFPPILVINLKERPDRWNQISKQLEQWNVPFERVDAIKEKIGWKGCTKSHLKCLAMAKERKYPWVLVLEDDCLFRAGAKERFEALLPVLWNRRNEWDIFNGGGSYIFKTEVVQKNPILLQFKSYAAHFILHQERNYDKIQQEAKGKIIDVYYRDNLVQWSTYPHLAIQSSGFSNLSNKNKNHNHTFYKSQRKNQRAIKRYSTRKNRKH